VKRGVGTIDIRIFVQHDSAMQLDGAYAAEKPERSADDGRARPRIKGLLMVYTALVAGLLLHGALLTVGAIIVYSDPAAAGLHSFVPLGALLFYVVTNTVLILYGVVLFVLMARRRRSAIVNNVLFNLLSIAFLLAWHLVGEKSNVGTLIDTAPNLLGAGYILLSRRVRSTFTFTGAGIGRPR
jgi:hypothetical protein